MNNFSISKLQTKYLSNVYAWMSFGLILTAITAFFVAGTPAILNVIFANKWTFWLLVLGQLALVTFISAGINSISLNTARLSFICYSILTGFLLSSIFFIYSFGSIASAFFICSAMFAALSIYGQVTKSDLSAMGTFLFMGLIGLVICNLVRIFFTTSNGFDFAVSILGVIIFSLLTAYDTQKIKQIAQENFDSNDLAKLSILGALTLYLDFINLFLYLLRLTGKKRN